MSIVLTPLLWIQLNQCVDPHDRHAGLHRALQLLDFAHARLKHAGLDAVVHAAFGQVEAVVAVALGLGDGFGVGVGGRLRGWVGVGVGCGGGGGCGVGDGVRGALGEGVAGAQLGDEVGGVFGGVDGEGGGDCEEGRGEGCDGELLS